MHIFTSNYIGQYNMLHFYIDDLFLFLNQMKFQYF